MLVQGTLLLFFLVLLVVSWKAKPTGQHTGDFLLAGRRLTLLPFVATLVTTAYGWILGIGELYYTHGISAWLFLSLPYTFFGVILAFFLAQKARLKEYTSIPQLLRTHYGPQVAWLGALLVLLFTSPAMYILMAAQLVEGVFEWPMWVCVAAALVFSTIYLYKGGFAALARHDSAKFVLMFGGFAAVLAYLVYTYGLDPLRQLPAEKTTFRPWELLPLVISWFFLGTMVLADPSYHQRIYASATPGIARKGILLSIVCWTIFDFLAASVALYGYHFHPGLDNAALVYAELASGQLPEGMQAVFILGMLATVLSTSDSLLFISAQTLTEDILPFIRGREQQRFRTGLLLVTLLTFGLLLFYLEKTAVNIFYDLTPLVVSGLVVPVLSAFLPGKKLSSVQMLRLMLTTILVTLLIQTQWNGLPFSPVVFGVPFAMILYLVMRLLQKA